MDPLRIVHAKIAAIENALAELKQAVAALEQAGVAAEPARAASLDRGTLRSEYDLLYASFLAEGPNVVERFVAQKTHDFLVAFCLANQLASEAAGLTRPKVALRIAQGLARRRALEKRRA